MRIAITGSTGRIGGQVTRPLAATGQHEVVALSRRTAPYDDPPALRVALDGIQTLVFVSSDGEAARVLRHHRNVLEAALECRVGHIVLLSGLDVAPESPFCYALTNGDTERTLAGTGIPYSIVRAGLFTGFFLDLIDRVGRGNPDGVVGLPAADARVSLVTRAEVARSLAALALGEPTNRHHEVAGPQCRPVSAITADTGRRYVEVTPAEFATTLLRLGEEPWWVYAYTTLFESIRQHRWETTSNAVLSHGTSAGTDGLSAEECSAEERSEDKKGGKKADELSTALDSIAKMSPEALE